MDKQATITRFPVLRFFEYAHLPPHLQAISRPFGELAFEMAEAHQRPESVDETQNGLRKLLEAKDCMVRAALAKPWWEAETRPEGQG